MNIVHTDPLLVIGAGSIGERHIQNLRSLGYSNLLVLRSRQLPMRNVGEDSLEILTSWDEVMERKPKAAFICTPTSMHPEQSLRCLEEGIHVLVEKPISHTPDCMDLLINAVKETGAWFQVGYMMRYHPFVAQVLDWTGNGRYGNLISFSTYWGEHLPYWHPWEDYRHSYAARKELGGGAALTLSHDLDLALHMIKSPLVSHSSLLSFRSGLEVNTDSGADFLLGFTNGITGHVHLNFFQKTPRREYRFEFEEASVLYRYFDNELEIITGKEKEVLVYPKFDRNHLFLDQTRDFFRNIEQGSIEDSIDNIRNAFRIVALCLGEPFH